MLKHGNQSSKSTGVAAAAPRRGCRYLCDRPIQSIPVWTQKYMNHYSWPSNLQTTQDLIIPPFVTCQWSGISGTIDSSHYEWHQVTSSRRKEEPFTADKNACIIDFFAPRYHNLSVSLFKQYKSIQSKTDSYFLNFQHGDDVVMVGNW